jgi:hypothetical protein
MEAFLIEVVLIKYFFEFLIIKIRSRIALLGYVNDVKHVQI